MASAEKSAIKQTISTSFKLSGLSLKSDAAAYFAEALSQVPEEQRKPWIDRTLRAIQQQAPTSPLIDRQQLRSVLQTCVQHAQGKLPSLRVYDAFSDVPRLVYNEAKNRFLHESLLGEERSCLLPQEVSARALMFRHRYQLIRQRCMRNELFRESSLGGAGVRYRLQPVELLLGQNGARLDSVLALGCLTQLSEGSFFLEDPSGAVRLDLSSTRFPVGLFAEGCFVLAEGWLEDRVLHCNVIGFPPAEDTASFRRHFGDINVFGGEDRVCARANTDLRALEERLSTAGGSSGMLVLLADVHLDCDVTLRRLSRLLAGFRDCPPTAFVLAGNFSCGDGAAESGRPDSYRRLRRGFSELGQLIAAVPELASQSRFIFVPGPRDPCVAPILPRAPLPDAVVDELRRLVPDAGANGGGVTMATNPCRLQYCTQEVVVFREDVLSKLCRHGIYYSTESCPDVAPHFVTTLTAQCHLAPLPAHVAPVYWRHDHALRLYPLPDLVVCADRGSAYTVSKLGCLFVNPGSFSRDGVFKVYMSDSRTVEDSHVED